MRMRTEYQQGRVPSHLSRSLIAGGPPVTGGQHAAAGRPVTVGSRSDDVERSRSMELGVHLPLMEFGGEGQSLARIRGAAVAARDCGFAAASVNDHFVFSTPWLDGPTALAAVIEHTAPLELATTVSLVALRGPVALAKSLAAIDLLSGGRLVAGVGPGSSQRDYDAVGIAFEDRWPRFEEAVALLRRLLAGESATRGERFAVPDQPLAPAPARPGGVPIWIGSWGSAAGLRRVARLGDGWLASAYNTTPARFAEARGRLAAALHRQGRASDRFPNGLATMWTWITEDRAEADRMLRDVLAPLLRRDADQLSEQVCIGGREHCLALLGQFAEAGCERVYLWPLGDEPRQLEIAGAELLPHLITAQPPGVTGSTTARGDER
jgi:alkanesulfonate monooxygenase SsuD/methylene tetrahydromethanopterin reductase-like flavin-dependent oxidoreductase (luciferase family)